MELFDAKGCLSEEGLQALVGGQLDETQRLEAAEHLAYCDRCMDRYTALLTDDVLEQPPRSARGAVMGTIWIRLMQNTWGRAAVATVAAVLALTMWRAGTLEQILHTGQQLNTWLPQTTQQTEPELLGKPVMLYANGIGPVRKPGNRRRVKKVVERATLVTLRDHSSARELADMGVTRQDLLVTADPVFHLAPAGEARCAQLLSGTGIAQRITAVFKFPDVRQIVKTQPPDGEILRDIGIGPVWLDQAFRVQRFLIYCV